MMNLLFMSLTDWVTGSVIVAVWCLVLFPLRRIIFKLIDKRLPKNAHAWSQILLRALRLPIKILILAGALSLATHFFPLSEQAQKVGNALVTILIVFSGVIFLSRFFVGLFERSEERHLELRNYSGMSRGIIYAIITLLGLMIVLDNLGVSITPLIASLGVGSLAIALALKDTLENFFAGFYLLIDKPIAAGEFIQLEGNLRGYVEKVTWRSTRIRLLENNILVVPNTKVASSVIINYHHPQKEMAVLVDAQVDYKSDLEQVERVTVEVAKEIMKTIEGGVPSFEPFIRYKKFDQFSIHFTVILRGQEFVAQYLIKHEFIKKLHERYEHEGIAFAYPTRIELVEKLKNEIKD